MGENNLYEIAVLIDDLKNEDVTARLNSVKNVHLIAQALGAGRARNELLPYLAESVDDEDEVLLEMAKSLGVAFVPHIGRLRLRLRLCVLCLFCMYMCI